MHPQRQAVLLMLACRMCRVTGGHVVLWTFVAARQIDSRFTGRVSVNIQRMQNRTDRTGIRDIFYRRRSSLAEKARNRRQIGRAGTKRRSFPAFSCPRRISFDTSAPLEAVGEMHSPPRGGQVHVFGQRLSAVTMVYSPKNGPDPNFAFIRRETAEKVAYPCAVGYNKSPGGRAFPSAGHDRGLTARPHTS